MKYQPDFVDAHDRHWEDAEMLFVGKCRANADQLYGLSAECGLKAVMQSLGMKLDPKGKPEEKQHQQHVNGLWPIFQDFAKNRGGARYSQMLPNGEPFVDWSIHERYGHRSQIHEAKINPHREAAREIRQMVSAAVQDGIL